MPIVLTPEAGAGELAIQLRGNLAAMLGATIQKKRVVGIRRPFPASSLVAGARNRRYLQLWSGAA
jgi:hypothetical protein